MSHAAPTDQARRFQRALLFLVMLVAAIVPRNVRGSVASVGRAAALYRAVVERTALEYRAVVERTALEYRAVVERTALEYRDVVERVAVTQTPAEHRVEYRKAVPDDTSRIIRRFLYEGSDSDNPFAITPHRPMYFIPAYYSSSPNNAEAGAIGFNHSLDRIESKFQISLKFLIWKGLISNNANLYIAYTQQNWWQVYNGAISSPFRETNYEPELFVMVHTNIAVNGMAIRLLNFGIDHQSNGRNVPASRSWNRIFAQIVVDIHNQVYLEIRPWIRLPEPKKANSQDPTGDDNPDIVDFMGSGHIRGIIPIGTHTVTFLVRENFKTSHHAAFQADWSFPMVRKIRGYVQFFSGYGESLIDYNHRATRFGAGIELTNWL